MAEQWISAEKALEIAGDRVTLCTRLFAGLIAARAQSISFEGKTTYGVAVPNWFWWAKGHEALEQDWSSGDFSTYIKGEKRFVAFGVTMALSAVLEMIPFEQRAIMARKLSVAGSTDWISARDAKRLAVEKYQCDRMNTGEAILHQARLGFICGRAVLAQGATGGEHETDWSWQYREWDIPTWFWNDFTWPGRSSQDWNLGEFAGHDLAPDGTRAITLSGVHFLRASLDSLASNSAPVEPPESNRGRKPKYDWPAAINACWGRIYRGEPPVSSQADVEKLLIELLRAGDQEPGESTVRPYASRIWAEFKEP